MPATAPTVLTEIARDLRDLGVEPVLVAVAAHADDAELSAGGTMAKWTGQGGRVHIVMATNNCSGNLIPENGDESQIHRRGPAETRAIRHAEQETAARLIAAEVHYLEYPQRHYWDEASGRAVAIGYGRPAAGPVPELLAAWPPLVIAAGQPETIDRLATLLVSLQPAVVITQTPLDVDPEHHAVASLTWRALAQSRPQLPGPVLRFWSPGSSCVAGLLDPGYDHIEDITDWFEQKRALCGAHRSQMTRQRWAMVEQRAAAWGRQIGVRFAEPFKTAAASWPAW